MADTPRRDPIDYRLLVPVLLHSMSVQLVVSIVRVTTSYRVVELDLPVVWLGILAATFALLPVFLAVSVGRFIDRGNDALVAWIGSGLLVAACAGLLVAHSSKLMLLAFMGLTGVGHLFLMASQQMLCLRCGSGASRESIFGNYMLAGSIGQGIGPYVVGWAGGAATVPPTQLLFAVGLVGALLTLAVALTMRPSRELRRAWNKDDVVSVRDLLRSPGLAALLTASVMAVTAQDLLIVYLPLVGAERKIDVSDIGVLLTVRAASAIVARLIYARMIFGLGRAPLMIGSMLAAGLGFAALGVPFSLGPMYAATAVIGFALGIATTLTVTGVVELTAASARGTANSIRIMGNRIGQVLLPFAAGLMAAATGAGGILAIIGASLVASAGAVHWSRPGNGRQQAKR